LLVAAKIFKSHRPGGTTVLESAPTAVVNLATNTLFTPVAVYEIVVCAPRLGIRGRVPILGFPAVTIPPALSR
jgi:hypothetical protein